MNILLEIGHKNSRLYQLCMYQIEESLGTSDSLTLGGVSHHLVFFFRLKIIYIYFFFGSLLFYCIFSSIVRYSAIYYDQNFFFILEFINIRAFCTLTTKKKKCI